MDLPNIPPSYMQMFFIIALLVLTILGFDHFVQASLGVIVGYLFGSEHQKIINDSETIKEIK